MFRPVHSGPLGSLTVRVSPKWAAEKGNIREYTAVLLNRDCEHLTRMNQKGTLQSAKSNDLLFIKVMAVFNWYVDTVAAVCCLQADLLFRLVRPIRKREIQTNHCLVRIVGGNG